MERLVVDQISVFRDGVKYSRQDTINIRISTGSRSADHADGNMVPLAISKISTQAKVILGAAVRELEPQLTLEEVDYITGRVTTRDESLIHYGQSPMNRITCPNPGVDGEVSARPKVHGRTVGHRNAVGPVKTDSQTDFPGHKRGVVYQRPVVRAVTVDGIVFQ